MMKQEGFLGLALFSAAVVLVASSNVVAADEQGSSAGFNGSTGTNLGNQAPFIRPAKLPAKLTPQKAQQLFANSRQKLSINFKAIQEKRQTKLNALQSKLSPARLAFSQEAAKNPQYQAFLKASQAIWSAKKGLERQNALNALYRSNQALIQGLVKKAGVNQQKANADSEAFARDFKTMFAGAIRGKLPPTAPQPLPTRHTFDAPFAITDTETKKSGIGFTDASAKFTQSNSTVKLSADANGGGCAADANGQAGVFVEVPAGFKKMKVSVYHDYSFKAGVWAALGLGHASMSTGIEVTKEGNPGFVELGSFEYESVIAPFAWYSEYENDETGLTSFTTDLNGEGTYLITFYVFAHALGGGGGGGGVDVTFKPRSIEVEFLK